MSREVDREPVYRPDIEGMRAVAVLCVLLYHVDLPFTGGFIGVDVFFVISGYLISRNVLRDLERGTFTFRGFYARRTRRLFPALAATMLLTLVAAYLLFAPDDMRRTGESAVFAVLSLSNVLFWKQVGYFDAAASSKALLHTWSLGVEEQFYLVWPAMLVFAARRFRKRGAAAVILVTGIVSLASAEWLRADHPAAVFFLAPFRMFQLCAGAVLAALPVPPLRRLLAELSTVAGLSAIVYAAVWFDAASSRQHLGALLPVAGAALLIAAGGSAASSRILSNRLAVGGGTISYSLYLVHWPLVVFYKYVHGRPLGPGSMVLLMLLTLLSATGLYYLVERPFRSRAAASRPGFRSRPLLLGCGVAAAAIVALGGSAWMSGGWPFRLPAALQSIPSETAMWQERNPVARVGTCFIDPNAAPFYDEKACLAIDPARPNYLIVGDSFAADAYVYLSAAYPGVNFLQATSGNCRPLIGLDVDASCRDLLRLVFETFLPHRGLDGIALSGAWQYADLDPLAATIGRLRPLVRRIVLVGAGVRFQANVMALIFQSRRLTTDAVEAYAREHITPFEFRLNRILQRRIGPKVDAYVDVQSMMCEGNCRLFSPEGQIMYVDFGHLTLAGARYLAPRIAARHPDLFPRTKESDVTALRNRSSVADVP